MKNFRENALGGIFTNIFVRISLIIWVIVELVPLGWILMSSFKTDPEIIVSPFSFPKSFYLGNYDITAFAKNDTFIVTYFKNSIIIVVVSLVILLFISLLAGYGIAKLKIPGKNVLLVILVVMIAIPMHALVIPLYYFFAKMNLVNNYFAVILPLVTINAPFAVVMLQAYFAEFPDELIDAGKIDGCSNLKVFFRVVLPCSFNSVSAVLIINFLFIWNDYFVVLVMLKSNLARTIPLGVASFIGQHMVNFGAIFSIVVMAIIPTVIIFIIFSKYIISGIMQGSIKG